jgi:hypothetical protein
MLVTMILESRRLARPPSFSSCMRHSLPPSIRPSSTCLESPDVCAGVSTSPRSKRCKGKERNNDLPVFSPVNGLGFRAHSELVTGFNSWSITRRYKSCTFPSSHQQIRRPSSLAPIHSFKQNIFPPDQTLIGYGSSFVSLAAFNACYWYFFHLFCRRDLWYVHQPRKYVSPLTDESVVGFYTHSLALVADAFHYVCFEIVFNFVKIWYLIQII